MAWAAGGRGGVRRGEPRRRPGMRVGRGCAGADRTDRPQRPTDSRRPAGAEQTVTTLLAVLAGGFAGAVARQVLSSAVQDRASTRFPLGILVVNLSGAFVLG